MLHKDMQLKWENMRAGIDAQADLLARAPRPLYEEVSGLLTGAAPTRLYTVGCGDSYFCGLAAEMAIELWTGAPVEALESLEFSRYAIRTAPEGSLVTAVSNSGEVARSVESLQFARERGLSTLGVTYNPESRLATAAEKILKYDYRDVGFGPGTMSYLASVLSLLAVGLRVAELGGRLDRVGVDAEIAAIEGLSPVLRETIELAEEPAARLAAALSPETDLFFVGGGPNYGTALFAMAKMIESTRHNTVSQQLEEWAHEQYFCCVPGTYTVVLAPQGYSVDRAREQLRAVRDMKGTAVAVCAADDEETKELADIVFPVPAGVPEHLSPLVYCVASELISYHFAVASEAVMLGFDDEWRKEVNFRQIFRSAIPASAPNVPGAR
ncbi:MAG TPA: SIS domain-containing protein [Amycolatopsis sp.]|nr:SIS domain-containing protein [Amycolatopsis sp.]